MTRKPCPCARGALMSSIEEVPRPAEHPASRLGAGQAGVDALDDDRPLELGEDAELNPATQIYCASAHPWVQLGGETKSFDRMPG
jgi:hypothetical protein